MKVERFPIPGPAMLTPKRHRDDRGYLAETFQAARFDEALGMAAVVQENLVLSEHRYTLRGLHCQAPPQAQAKLVAVLVGSVLDVAVDVRRGSPTYACSVTAELTATTGNMLYVPAGLLHGYLTLEANTLVLYKLDALYAPASERAVRFDDPVLAVDWGVPAAECLVSDRDRAAGLFAEFDSPFVYAPPR